MIKHELHGWLIYILNSLSCPSPKKKGGHLIFKLQYYKDMLNAY